MKQKSDPPSPAESPPLNSGLAAGPPLVHWWWRGWYVALGLLMLGLGFLGAYLPVLPTTPFLLLATYFLARSWPELNRRVHQLPVFGKYLRDWDQHRGVRRGVKWWATGAATLTASGGLWFGGATVWIQVAVFGLLLVGLVVVWTLPTIKSDV